MQLNTISMEIIHKYKHENSTQMEKANTPCETDHGTSVYFFLIQKNIIQNTSFSLSFLFRRGTLKDASPQRKSDHCMPHIWHTSKRRDSATSLHPTETIDGYL